MVRKNSKKVQKLNLSDKKADPEGSCSVGDGLNETKRFQWLYLRNTQIGPEVTRSISDGLNESRTIQMFE